MPTKKERKRTEILESTENTTAATEMVRKIESLSSLEFTQIVDSLNENDRWYSLAVSLRSFRVQIEFEDVELQKWRTCGSPSTSLLQELKNRDCPISVLKHMLLEANLLETLAVIADPEPLNIVVQPDGDVDCRRHQGIDEKCQHVSKDTELELKCLASGMPPPKYQWYLDNTSLKGCTEPTLKIANFSFKDEGEYKCLVSQKTRDGTNVSKESESVVCEVLHSLPELSRPFWGTKHQTLKPSCVTDPVIEAGKAFAIAVEVKCDSPCVLQWCKDNVVLTGKKSKILQINKATVADSGKYLCLASNDAGDVSSSKIDVRVERPHPRPTSKLALLIGNSNYPNFDEDEQLMTPSNDIALLAERLKNAGFGVISLVNLSLDEMKRAIDGFFELLSPGSYAVFCFIGHGFHCNNRDYMMPVDCECADDEHPLDSSSVICDDILVQKAIQLGLGLFVMIADWCRRKQRCSFNGGNDMEDQDDCENVRNSQTHIIRLYSTSENQSAYEVKSRKSGIYIPYLCEHIFQDKPIYDAVGDANKSFRNHPLAKKQTPAMKAQGINSMKLTEAAVKKVPVVLEDYEILDLPFPLHIIPHRGHICNALDVIFQRQLSDIKFELPEGLGFRSENAFYGITIYNIQKAKGAFPVNVCWRDPKTNEPQGPQVVHLHGTLVGPARDKIF